MEAAQSIPQPELTIEEVINTEFAKRNDLATLISTINHNGIVKSRVFGRAVNPEKFNDAVKNEHDRLKQIPEHNLHRIREHPVYTDNATRRKQGNT